MGKNYEEELAAVPSTAAWAHSLDLAQCTAGFSHLRARDLIVVASGGSISAAQLVSQLHMCRTGRLSVVMTPLEFIAEQHPLDAAVCFISAGGGNSDILSAWKKASYKSPTDLALICGKTSSALAKSAQVARVPALALFDLPAGGDGFLASNSLVAFFCIAMRLYDVAPGALPSVPTSRNGNLLSRQTIVVLYGGWLKPIAIDLESRFTEAALGSVQIADFRNFAHGRHHWLAKRGTDAAVLALVSPRFADLARDTLSALPKELPRETWVVDDDSASGAFQLLPRSLALAGEAARRLGYDAGRPGVPEFGHQIYDLRTQLAPLPAIPDGVRALGRKLRGRGEVPKELLDRLQAGWEKFRASLASTIFTGAVLDFDGTVVATTRRFDPIEPAMAACLNRLLGDGIAIGIATGRGKSVHKELRTAIDAKHWPRVIVGYYNGSVIRGLDESCDALAEGPPAGALRGASDAVRAASELIGAAVEDRSVQVTVTCHGYGELGLWAAVREVLDRSKIQGVKVAHSSHSVDILPLATSKASVIIELALRCGGSDQTILKIGDRGKWPGNDAELLAMDHGISVDEVSISPDSCWNFAPTDVTSIDATLWYLDRLQHGRVSV